MAEIALSTVEFFNQKEKYAAWRPVGSVVVAMSDDRIKRKWIEIICDFPSAAKRASYDGLIPGFDKVLAAWSPTLLGEWVEHYRQQRNQFNKPADDAFWTEKIAPLHLLEDMPKDPLGLRPVYETWVWSEHERKSLYIVTASESTSTVEGWNGRVALDKDGNEITWAGDPPTPSAPVVSIVPRRRVNYKTDITGITSGELADVANPDVVVHPRFDKPIAKTAVLAIPNDEITARIAQK